MKSREILKTSESTKTQPYSKIIKGGAVDQALSRVRADTGNEAIVTEEKGIPLEKYQEGQGRKPVKPPNKEKGVRNKFNALEAIEKAYPLDSWVIDNIPTKLLGDTPVERTFFEIFQKASLEKVFLGVWNYKIDIPEELNEKDLIFCFSRIIKNLEDLSSFHLGSEEIASSENILIGISRITKEINFHGTMIEDPSKDLYDRDKDEFIKRVSSYLKRKIVVEKLQKILRILMGYQTT